MTNKTTKANATNNNTTNTKETKTMTNNKSKLTAAQKELATKVQAQATPATPTVDYTALFNQAFNDTKVTLDLKAGIHTVTLVDVELIAKDGILLFLKAIVELDCDNYQFNIGLNNFAIAKKYQFLPWFKQLGVDKSKIANPFQALKDCIGKEFCVMIEEAQAVDSNKVYYNATLDLDKINQAR